MVVTFRLKPTTDRGGGPLECIGETVGTTPIPEVLYSNILAQVRSIEHDSWLPVVILCNMCVYRGTSSEKRSGPEVLYNRKNLYSNDLRTRTDCMDATNTTIGADMSLIIYIIYDAHVLKKCKIL